jgi:hypothetical protein
MARSLKIVKNCDIAMKHDYSHVIAPMAAMLFTAIEECSPNFTEILAELERLIAEILRQVGLQTVKMVLNKLCQQLISSAQAQGMVVHRRTLVKYSVLFGCGQNPLVIYKRFRHVSVRLPVSTNYL